MHKDVKKTKVICRCLEYPSNPTGSPTVMWEYNTVCISIFESKRVTARVKHIDINVWFLQEQFHNGLFIQKYEKYGVMPSNMFTKPCSGPITSKSTKSMTGFILYPTSDTERYQIMILHGCNAN